MKKTSKKIMLSMSMVCSIHQSYGNIWDAIESEFDPLETLQSQPDTLHGLEKPYIDMKSPIKENGGCTILDLIRHSPKGAPRSDSPFLTDIEQAEQDLLKDDSSMDESDLFDSDCMLSKTPMDNPDSEIPTLADIAKCGDNHLRKQMLLALVLDAEKGNISSQIAFGTVLMHFTKIVEIEHMSDRKRDLCIEWMELAATQGSDDLKMTLEALKVSGTWPFLVKKTATRVQKKLVSEIDSKKLSELVPGQKPAKRARK